MACWIPATVPIPTVQSPSSTKARRSRCTRASATRLGRCLDRPRYGVEVLGLWVGSVRPPGDDRGFPEIVHLEPHPAELIDESGGADRRWRLLLADTTGGGS
jgi:hypothetical protein